MKTLLKSKTLLLFCILMLFVSSSYAQDYNSHLQDMVYVEGGMFEMGSNDSDAGLDEKPVHSVTLSSYYIGKYEVTQQQWQDVMGNNPSSSEGSDKPVTNVTWYDCVEFCNALSRKAGLEECYEISDNNVTLNMNSNGYRLPTEAEWEYAARGGTKSTGGKYSGSNDINTVAWYNENSNGELQSPGLLQCNELGIYDMSGNVWEWCWDLYGNYSNSSEINPTGAISGPFRVRRGGSYYHDAGICRSTVRLNYKPTASSFVVGFRLVCRP